MELFHYIEISYIRNSKKIKIRSLHFDNDYISVPFETKQSMSSDRYTTPLDKAIDILQAGGFKIKGYGIYLTAITAKKTAWILSSSTLQQIKPLTTIYKTLSENPFKSLKVTAQKLTNQKPIKRYKKCI